MRAGALRDRITLQAPPTAQDAAGQPAGNWTDVATVWAEVRDLSGREFIAAQATQSEVSTKIRIRYMTGIDASMRAVRGADVYTLVAPPLDPDGRRRELVLMCTKGVPHA